MRFLMMFGALAFVAALLGPHRLRRGGLVVLALVVLYAVLKLTGIIGAAQPDRIGVS